MEQTFLVNLTPEDTCRLVYDAVVNGSVTGELRDDYQIGFSGGVCRVQVYEKHYYRVGNRLTLTLTVDNADGATRVHIVGGGGGSGLFKFDWGASRSFSNVAYSALQPYILN